MDVSVIIPVYNALALARQCVHSLYECGSTVTFEVIVVDNGSAPDVELWLAEQVRQRANFRFLRYPEPLGFARSVNVGVAAATGDVLIILNSDTLVTSGWMEGLHHLLQADPSLGAITPYTNHAGDPAQMDFGTVDLPPQKALSLVAKRKQAANHTKPRVLYLPQRLTFFCVALRRAVWDEFQGLDEAFRVGNYEDDDLCLRLRVAGYRLAVALDVYVYHHNNATFNANKISHDGWMTQNVATFATHARALAESSTNPPPRWPRRSQSEISVVILPRPGAPLDRTLQSLANQTITDFEVLPPRDNRSPSGSQRSPSGSWIAYVTQGDILYPFHLEALHEAMERNGIEAIFADPWVRSSATALTHPDTLKQIRSAPLLLAGWMHHASLHPDRLFDEVIPLHWPRITWELPEPPALEPPPPTRRSLAANAIDLARTTYRKLLPLETRLTLDKTIRRLIRRPLPDPDKAQLEKLTQHLQQTIAATESPLTNNTLPAVFLFNVISWAALTQRQQHFARGLAERGHAVFWIEPTLSPPRNWWTSRALPEIAPGVHMLRLPGLARDIYHMEWNHSIHQALLDAMTAALQQTALAYGVTQAVTLVNYPRWQPLVEHLRARLHWPLVSDILDDQRAMSGIFQTPLFSYEHKLLACSDLVVTSSIILQQRLLPQPSTLLPNAVDFDLFASATPDGRFQDHPRPLIGFFGALADWLDMPLIHAAALHFPAWTFVYIGPHTFSHSGVEVEWLRNTHLPNIIVLPQMDPRTLAASLAAFDVCTIPFQDIPVTHAMNPVKLYEYLAVGKPVVSRDLPEVRHLAEGEAAGLVTLYETSKQFFAALESALASDTPDLQARRRAFAQSNDWAHRVETLSHLLTDLVATPPSPDQPR